MFISLTVQLIYIKYQLAIDMYYLNISGNMHITQIYRLTVTHTHTYNPLLEAK